MTTPRPQVSLTCLPPSMAISEPPRRSGKDFLLEFLDKIGHGERELGSIVDGQELQVQPARIHPVCSQLGLELLDALAGVEIPQAVVTFAGWAGPQKHP